MKQEITAVEFQNNFGTIIDELIRTGRSISVRWNDNLVKIMPPKPAKPVKKTKKINDLSKLKPFMKLPFPADDYVHFKVDEWKPVEI